MKEREISRVLAKGVISNSCTWSEVKKDHGGDDKLISSGRQEEVNVAGSLSKAWLLGDDDGSFGST